MGIRVVILLDTSEEFEVAAIVARVILDIEPSVPHATGYTDDLYVLVSVFQSVQFALRDHGIHSVDDLSLQMVLILENLPLASNLFEEFPDSSCLESGSLLALFEMKQITTPE